MGAAPEVDLVEVHLQDFVFGVGAFDAHGEQRFLDLARDRVFEHVEQVARELLRDGAAALYAPAVAHVAHQRARDAEEIDAPVRIELPVLDGDESGGQIRGQLLEWHQRAVFDEELAHDARVGAEDLRLQRGLDHLEARRAGEIPREITVRRKHQPGEEDHPADHDVAHAPAPPRRAAALGGGCFRRRDRPASRWILPRRGDRSESEGKFSVSSFIDWAAVGPRQDNTSPGDGHALRGVLFAATIAEFDDGYPILKARPHDPKTGPFAPPSTTSWPSFARGWSKSFPRTNSAASWSGRVRPGNPWSLNKDSTRPLPTFTSGHGGIAKLRQFQDLGHTVSS